MRVLESRGEPWDSMRTVYCPVGIACRLTVWAVCVTSRGAEYSTCPVALAMTIDALVTSEAKR